MMKILTSCLIFLNLIFLSHQASAQENLFWENVFAKADKAYYEGAYNAALRKSETAGKKYATLEAYPVWKSIHKARTYEALGKYSMMESALAEAQNGMESLKNSNFRNYAIASYKMAEVYIEYGNFVKADEILSGLERETLEKMPSDSILLTDIRQQKSVVYKNQWRFRDAASLNDANIDFFTSNQLNSFRNAPKAQTLHHRLLYASMLRLKGEILSEKGDYENAGLYFEEKEKEMKQVVSPQSPEYGKYLMAIARNYEAQGLEKKAYKHFEDASKVRFKKSSKLYFDNFINFTVLSFDEKRRKIAKNNLEYADKIIYAFYRGKNIYRYKKDLLNVEWLIHQNKFKNAESRLQEIIEGSKEVVPFNHPFSMALREKMYQLHIRKGLNFPAAEDDLDSSSRILENLYGANSPKNLNNQIRKSVFLLENTDRVKEGIGLMSGRPQDLVMTELAKESEDRIGLLNYLARYHDNIEEYDSALVYANIGLDLLVKKEEVKAEENKVIKGSKLLDNSKAVNKIRAIINAWRMKELPRQYLLLAKIKTQKGDYKNAEQDMNAALDIYKKKFNAFSTDYAEALSSAARLYGIIGLYDEAESLLKKSSRIYRRTKVDISQNANAVEELAFLYARIGEYAQTEELLKGVIKTKEDKYGKNSKTLINPLNQLGQLYLITGDYKNAEFNIRRANGITQLIYGDQTLLYAENLGLLSKLSMAIGDYDKAEEYQLKGLEIQKKLLNPNHMILANSLTDLGYIKFFQNVANLKMTDSLFKKAKDIVVYNFDENHPLYAEAIKNIAFVSIEEELYDDALVFLNKADAIWVAKLGPENKNSAEIAVLKGDIDSKMKDYDGAEQNYKKAQTLYGEIFSTENPNYISTLSKLGKNYFVKGNFVEANKAMDQTTNTYLKFLQNYFPSLSEREKSKYWSLMRPDFEFYNTLAINQLNTNPLLVANMYKFTLATKALLLSSSIKVKEQILNGDNEELKVLYKDWVNKKELLTNALSMSDAQLKEANIKPAQLQNEVENIEKELGSKSDAFKNSEARIFTWEDVKARLKPEEAAVEMIRFRYFSDRLTDSVLYAALIVSPTTLKQPDIVILTNGKALEGKYLKNYRNSVKNQIDDKLSYKNFWQPIEAKIGGATRIYFSPDGAYNQINLESMLIEDQVYVIDKFNIRLVSNTKDIIEKGLEKDALAKSGITKEANKTAELVGNPIFYASLANKEDSVKVTQFMRSLETQKISMIGELPGTGKELSEINNLLISNGWQTTILDRLNAEESKVKLITNPRVFHIATHGFFVPNTTNTESVLQSSNIAQSPLLRSGLLMEGSGDLLARTPGNFNSEDGILTAAEVPNLNFDDTELVVLSACETGLGEVQIGEGVFGLQRSFLVAGTDALIMSLFKVNDEVTQKLMTKFYTKWLQTNDKRASFNEAQKEIKAEYIYPKYWGAFNMIGVE